MLDKSCYNMNGTYHMLLRYLPDHSSRLTGVSFQQVFQCHLLSTRGLVVASDLHLHHGSLGRVIHTAVGEDRIGASIHGTLGRLLGAVASVVMGLALTMVVRIDAALASDMMAAADHDWLFHDISTELAEEDGGRLLNELVFVVAHCC